MEKKFQNIRSGWFKDLIELYEAVFALTQYYDYQLSYAVLLHKFHDFESFHYPNEY